MKKVRPTIYDLERLTGFSTGSISRAFNESSTIKASTRELILKKAREIGYIPHAAARAITQGRTRRWGLLLPHLKNPRYAELMECLDGEARRRATMLLLGLSHFDPAIESGLALHWASGETDGIIADSCLDAAVFEQLREREFPMVFLFGRPSAKYNMVQSTVGTSCRKLLEDLVRLGHRRIAYLGQESPTCRIHDSFTTYEETLRHHGLPADDTLITFGTRDYTAGSEAWERWRSSPRRPTAVLCYNDIIACKFIERVQEDGLQIPRDISVIGSDDIPEAALCRLTTTRIDPAEMARAAFEFLDRGAVKKGRVHFVEATIIERGSVGPAPKARKY